MKRASSSPPTDPSPTGPSPEPEVLILRRHDLEAIIAQARAEYPNEACGLLGGREGRVERVYPTRNVLNSPVRYRVAEEDLLAALLDMEARGWGPDPLGIYHSHPHGPETPSATDVAESFYPDSIYLIISHVAREKPVVRAFRIVGGQVREITVQIAPA
ncbi:MAG: M67 family peptidase [Chloroflexi bacterium]|nr:MAG: M67 family peptidase [Chloroflexota bacterium]